MSRRLLLISLLVVGILFLQGQWQIATAAETDWGETDALATGTTGNWCRAMGGT